jgi:hypothetical protein
MSNGFAAGFILDLVQDRALQEQSASIKRLIADLKSEVARLQMESEALELNPLTPCWAMILNDVANA